MLRIRVSFLGGLSSKRRGFVMKSYVMLIAVVIIAVAPTQLAHAHGVAKVRK